MNRLLSTSILFTLFILLSGCTLNSNVAQLYKQEPNLDAEITLDDSISTKEEQTIEILLTKDGNPVDQVDNIHVEIWKQDGSIPTIHKIPDNRGNGKYQLTTSFSSEGLYFIKAHIKHQDSEIIPKQQFIVGELSDNDLEYLQKDIPEQERSHDHHH
ncbi:FixH family protein [Virgibacillus salexigens]|uniref:YtkA-like domain-containing protein n=2 Tax=Virgibacillus TaxID=84406 RepID=A0A024QGT8_9BACI|nr:MULTISPECIES: FixH family protein [Virgibacillus]GGJ68563.1 hypothetical protein GCM10007111_32930 [Virgibacillus kapii]CDQ41171.1 hypothetical protein BN990_03526 [Virgibacillus massiliensis]